MIATTTNAPTLTLAHAHEGIEAAVHAVGRGCTAPVEARGTAARGERPTSPCQDTRFQLGNVAWRARRSPGRRRRFPDAETLGAACVGYLRWCDANPLIDVEPVVYRGAVTMLLEVPRLRPYTIAGLCTHLKVGRSTWGDYRRRPAFSAVCEWVEDAIWVQQFEGAAVGLFDPRIIAWSLGQRRDGLF